VGRSIGEITRATATATANSLGENPREEFEPCGDTIFFFPSFVRPLQPNMWPYVAALSSVHIVHGSSASDPPRAVDANLLILNQLIALALRETLRIGWSG